MNYGAYEVPVIASGSARATVAGEYLWESQANGQRGDDSDEGAAT